MGKGKMLLCHKMQKAETGTKFYLLEIKILRWNPLLFKWAGVDFSLKFYSLKDLKMLLKYMLQKSVFIHDIISSFQSCQASTLWLLTTPWGVGHCYRTMAAFFWQNKLVCKYQNTSRNYVFPSTLSEIIR